MMKYPIFINDKFYTEIIFVKSKNILRKAYQIVFMYIMSSIVRV